jgi:hypothetical protein
MYVQNVSVRKTFTIIVDGQPGAADQDIYSIPGPFDCSIGEFFWKAAEQWTPFLDSTKRWRVLIQNTNPAYEAADNDAMILRNAAIVAPSISWQQNAMQVSALDFKAESRESGGAIVSP